MDKKGCKAYDQRPLPTIVNKKINNLLFFDSSPGDIDASSTIGRFPVMILGHQISVFKVWESWYLLYCIIRISVFVDCAIIGQNSKKCDTEVATAPDKIHAFDSCFL